MSKKSGQSVSEGFFDRAGNWCVYRQDGSLSVQTLNKEPSLTLQSEKDACDVNKILASFAKTGIMRNVTTKQPLQGDFTEVVDYQTAVNSVIGAEEAFMALPATIRKRFGNDPGALMDFLKDPQNRAEAISLGLIDKTAEQAVSPTESGKEVGASESA